MTAPAVTDGTFVNFRLVGTRKVAQLIVEVPIEKANQALEALGGVPDAANPAHVAIARLQEPASKPETPKTNGKAKRAWHELTPAEQAGMRCQEEAFQRFLREAGHQCAVDSDGAARVVRHMCDVVSRSDLNANDAAFEEWRDLDSKYKAWMAAG